MRALAVATVIVAVLFATSPAYAYIDPNAGGPLFQLLTPILALGAAGIAFARRHLRRAYLSLIRAVIGLVQRTLRISSRAPELGISSRDPELGISSADSELRISSRDPE
jgi:hypothetical protein